MPKEPGAYYVDGSKAPATFMKNGKGGRVGRVASDIEQSSSRADATPPPTPTPDHAPFQRVWSDRLGRYVFTVPDDPLYQAASGGPREPINPEFRNPTVTPAEPMQTSSSVVRPRYGGQPV